MTRYIDWVLGHRAVVLAAFSGATVFFAVFALQANISSTPREMFFGDAPIFDRYMERNREFGGDHIAIIGLAQPAVLSPESLARLQAAVESVERIPDVERVLSLASAQHIGSENDTLVIEDYADLLMADPGRADRLLVELTTDPMTRDWLVSPDGRHTVAIVEFAPRERSAEVAPKVVDDILAAFSAAGFSDAQVHRGGIVAVLAELIHQAWYSLEKALPLAALVLTLSVYLMFHRLWPVVITLLITLLAITWTMGLAVLLYGHVNIMTTMIPALTLITCFADVIHLCSAYLLELEAGRTKDRAIRRVGREVGTACGYTSVTTFLGFVAMTLVPAPIFKQLGLLMGFSVAMALFMALTLVPIFLSALPAPRPWRDRRGGGIQLWLDRLLRQAVRVATGRPRAVVALFGLLMAAAVFGAWQLTFETQFSRRLGPANPIRVGLAYFQQHFPGTNPLDIYIDTGRRDGLLSPALFAKVAELESAVEQRPEVVQVASVVDLVRRLYRELDPAAAGRNPLPDDRRLLAQLLLLFEMSGGRDLDRFVDAERRTLRLSARLGDMGVIEMAAVGRAIVADADRRLGPGVVTEVFGLEYLLGEWVDEVVRGQRRGLAFALATIAVMMAVAMRSVRIGLISMVPNTLPLMVLLGYTGLFWHRVDTDTLAVLIVAIGIGVDDTIHFLMRLRFESTRQSDLALIIGNTFHYSGRAIVITSVILAMGFAPFAGADYFSVRIFGTLLPVSVAVALAADLLLVPAMVQLGWIRFPTAGLGPARGTR
jgi:predicted RND superfamily exporter protein